MSPSGTYGYSKKMDFVHYFRNSKVIHRTSGNGGHAWLFHAKPEWDPSHPFTCPECKKILEQEKKEEQALKASIIYTTSIFSTI